MQLVMAETDQCTELSDLCLRSKAYWEYDEEFIEACRDALTVSAEAVQLGNVMTAVHANGGVCGVAQIITEGENAILDKLFIDPPAIGTGAGKILFHWVKDECERRGVKAISIDADPDAEPFYAAMGAKTIGKAESTVTPGRFLPLMEYRL